MSRWRYIAQRVLTGEFLDWDIPIEVEETSWELSGPGALRGTISPDVAQLRAADGNLVLQEWSTALYAEADGVIRWGGLLVSSSFDGEDWRIEAAGFSSYASGMPYLDVFAVVGIDPINAFKEVWRHLQSYPDGRLGINVTGARSSPVRLGEPAVKEFTEYFVDNNWQPMSPAIAGRIIPKADGKLAESMTTTSMAVKLVALGNFGALDRYFPYTISVGNEDILIGSRTGLTLNATSRGRNGTKASTHYKGTGLDYHLGTKSRKNSGTDAQPYQLAYWEAPDCGSELQHLATETPFDFVERHYWDGDVIRHDIEIGYPRIGRRRDDLAFVQGDNITNVVAVESNADHFANEVVGIGAGEGRATLRRTTAVRDGRLRRSAVFTDKTVKTNGRMDAFIADEMTRRAGLLSITSVDVVDHPNAQIGSWQIGDDVLIRADIPWLGAVDLWCRITGWSLTGESTARLSLARSDSFRYGGTS